MASQSKLPSRRLPGSGKARPMSMFVSSSDLAKQKNDAWDGDSQEEGSAGSRSTSRLSKRRSLLPQFSRKEEKEKIHAPATEEEDGEDDPKSASTSEATSDRLAMPPPPKPSRPLSMIRAPGLGIPGRTASLRSHVRKASKMDEAPSGDPVKAARPVSMIVKSDSGLKRSGSTRLPQSPPRKGVPATQQTAKSTHNRTRTSSSGAASVLKAPTVNTNVRTRSPSQTSPTSPTQASSIRPTSKSQLPPSSRPAFNTYQQHYSPVKAPSSKPPIPTSKAPKPASGPDADILITFDIARDQLELLLLSLTHHVSATSLQSLEISAKQSLSRRHARLYKEFASVRAREHEHRRTANLATLETWCPEPALLAEHLQTLNRVVTDLTALTEPGSRYSDMTASFEDWMASAEPLLFDTSTLLHQRQSQSPAPLRPGTASSFSSLTSKTPITSSEGAMNNNNNNNNNNGNNVFIPPLPESFRATRTSLALKLRAIQHDLSILPPCPPPSDSGAGGEGSASSLEIVVRNCSSLADGMLRELDVMARLEREVLARERGRIQERVEGLVSCGGEDGEGAGAKGGKGWVPAWERVGV